MLVGSLLMGDCWFRPCLWILLGGCKYCSNTYLLGGCKYCSNTYFFMSLRTSFMMLLLLCIPKTWRQFPVFLHFILHISCTPSYISSKARKSKYAYIFLSIVKLQWTLSNLFASLLPWAIFPKKVYLNLHKTIMFVLKDLKTS